MSVAVAWHRAARLIAHVESPPVDVEAVAATLGLTVVRDDLGVGVSGLLVSHQGAACVCVHTADHRLMGLAPMAVSPSMQRGGIGSELVKTGLLRCTESDVGAVAVLGHPQYYPRFGFRPASQWGIKSEYEVPEEVFMMMELSPGYLQGYQGIIRYDAAFADI